MRNFLWALYKGSPAVKRSAWKLYQWSIRLQSRHNSPYITHVPILAALSSLVEPRRITEFGAGDYSTGLFLNRSVFPHLESLISLENDAAWYERIRENFGADGRLDLREIEGNLSNVVSGELLVADLVFIDDSDHAIRQLTIAAVGKAAPSGLPVVVHDAEYVRTRMAIRRAFDHYFVFNAFHPQTALAWNGDLQFKHRLPGIARRISDASSRISPWDGETWRALSVNLP